MNIHKENMTPLHTICYYHGDKIEMCIDNTLIEIFHQFEYYFLSSFQMSVRYPQ